jgi:hypothetical protein
MSTLEKTITLLQTMPETSIEKVYQYIQVLQLQTDDTQIVSSAFGIAHKYANLDLIEKEKKAFENAMFKKHSNR